MFACGYLLVWATVGLAAYGAAAASASLPTETRTAAVAAALALAGVYQFTALKQSCLGHCRTPLSFLMGRWQSGYAGALKLAGAHAAYCIGCCSALMVVLVAAGAMSLPWVLLIALIVFIEKLLPRGDFVARMVGVGFVVLGLAVAIDPELAATLRGTAMSSPM